MREEPKEAGEGRDGILTNSILGSLGSSEDVLRLARERSEIRIQRAKEVSAELRSEGETTFDLGQVQDEPDRAAGAARAKRAAAHANRLKEMQRRFQENQNEWARVPETRQSKEKHGPKAASVEPPSDAREQLNKVIAILLTDADSLSYMWPATERQPGTPPNGTRERFRI